MGTDVVAVGENPLSAIYRTADKVEQAYLVKEAMELVHDDRCRNLIPRLLQWLPWNDSSDDVQARIAAQLLTADDPDAIGTGANLPGISQYVGKVIQVHDLKVMASDIDSGWGAYLILDVTTDEDPTHRAVGAGSYQIITRLARAYAEGKLDPERGKFITGEVVEVAQAKKGQNAPLGLRVYDAF